MANDVIEKYLNSGYIQVDNLISDQLRIASVQQPCRNTCVNELSSVFVKHSSEWKQLKVSFQHIISVGLVE